MEGPQKRAFFRVCSNLFQLPRGDVGTPRKPVLARVSSFCSNCSNLITYKEDMEKER